MNKESIEKLLQYNKEERAITPKVFEKWREKKESVNIYSFVYNNNIHYAIEYFFVDNDILQTKNCFYVCGLIDEYCVNNYNSTFLDYGIYHVCYAVLSDNEEMIQRYAKLRYKAYGKRLSMDEYVLKGEGAILCNTIQFFMENNNEGIERNLNIYELKKTKILRSSKTGELDYDFFKALYTENKGNMENILEKFLTPKIHKYRTNDIILDKFISLPAIGYAKLAWRKGIEVEVNSKLVPKELLPVQPLEDYEIPYEFLK
ncbi:hypothetical protein FACS189413_04770 [Bacteroidia bacterium]|nr:hypothetical protein FACS189413_04770 [Bacteroidia bacterium]